MHCGFITVVCNEKITVRSSCLNLKCKCNQSMCVTDYWKFDLTWKKIHFVAAYSSSNSPTVLSCLWPRLYPLAVRNWKIQWRFSPPCCFVPLWPPGVVLSGVTALVGSPEAVSPRWEARLSVTQRPLEQHPHERAMTPGRVACRQASGALFRPRLYWHA